MIFHFTCSFVGVNGRCSPVLINAGTFVNGRNVSVTFGAAAPVGVDTSLITFLCTLFRVVDGVRDSDAIRREACKSLYISYAVRYVEANSSSLLKMHLVNSIVLSY